MKKIGFIGAYDKIDFMLYISKILVEMGKRVIVIDGTITQKSRYIVPTINRPRNYITEFEGIDVAVGFQNFENIKEYLGCSINTDLDYDIALIDLDTITAVENFELDSFEQNYFVTSFDAYSIKKGIESISRITSQVRATKVLFSRDILKEEDEYLNFLSSDSKIVWDDEKIYLPFEVGDQTVIYNNQRVEKIKFKRLSSQYKDGLIYITTKILENEADQNLLRRAFKKIEKGV